MVSLKKVNVLLLDVKSSKFGDHVLSLQTPVFNDHSRHHLKDLASAATAINERGTVRVVIGQDACALPQNRD